MEHRVWAERRAKPRRLSLLAALLVLPLVFSCGGRTVPKPEDGVAGFMDEAFAVLLPEAAEILARLPDGSKPGPGPGQGPGPGPGPELGKSAGQIEMAAPLTLAAPLALAAIETAVERTIGQWMKNGETMPKALVVSPLAASRLARAAGNKRAPLPQLVVPFAAGFGFDPPTKIHAIEYDFDAAYSAMGRKAARYLRKISGKQGNAALCGIVFQENFMRGRTALEAFVTAFEAEIGQGRLEVKVLDKTLLALDPTGATKDAILRLAKPAVPAKDGPVNGSEAGGVDVVVLAIDDAFVAESAAADSLAESAATGKAGPIFLADQSSWGVPRPLFWQKPGLFRYGIWGDEASLAWAAIEAAKNLAEGRPVDTIKKVPLRSGATFPRIF